MRFIFKPVKYVLFFHREHIYGSTIDMVESDNSPTYYYSTEWRDQIVDTSGFHMRFGHENPTRIPIESRTQLADHVHIGRYELGADIKGKIANWVDFTSDTRPDDASVKLHSGFYYHCNDVWEPEVGDVRIMFSFAGLEGSKVLEIKFTLTIVSHYLPIFTTPGTSTR